MMRQTKKMAVCATVWSCLAMMPASVWAQDVLVTEDGDAIKAWQVDMGGSKIYYRAGETEDAPLKSIDKKSVLLWKKADGTRVVMGQEEQKPAAAQRKEEPAPAPAAPAATAFEVNPNLEADNLRIVQEFNNRNPYYLKDDTKKRGDAVAWLFGIKEGSIISTPELEASFSTGFFDYKKNFHPLSDLAYGSDSYNLVVSLKNKSDKMIFMDLGNSFFIVNGNATPYYTPSTTSSSSSNSSGGSVNMGALTGGILGGLTLGGGNTSSSTTITYSQRIISIPPMASVSLAPMSLMQNITCTGDNDVMIQSCLNSLSELGLVEPKKRTSKLSLEGILRGEIVPLPGSDKVAPVSIHLTYSLDEAITTKQSMRMNFYVSKVMGVNNKTYISQMADQMDLNQTPMVFFTWHEMELKNH